MHVNRDPSERELGQFGLILKLVALASACLVAIRGRETGVLPLAVFAALMVSVIVWFAPRARRAVYLSWMYAGFPVGWLVSHALLAIIFYAVLTPIGLVMRLAGRDPLCRRFDRGARSYWLKRRQAPPLERYFRQF